MTGWCHPDYRVWKVILGTWNLTTVWDSGKCKMSDGMWDLTAILRKQYLPKSWHRMIYWERKRYLG